MFGDDIVTSVIELYEKKDWKTIIESYREHPQRNRLLWVFPTVDNFAFIRECLVELECNKILSVGCGSGLLEWMLSEATGYEVSGIEVDGGWWKCKYAPPVFIPLILTTPDFGEDMINMLRNSNNTALLFCYFNNGPAFEQYLDYYSGATMIIIGPGHGKGVHTDPRPFGDVPEEWMLHGSQEVASSRDFIAIYCKKNRKLLEL